MFDKLIQFITEHPQVAGALTLVVGAALSWLLADLPRAVFNAVRKIVTISVEMDNTQGWDGRNENLENFHRWYMKNGLLWLSRTFRMTSGLEPTGGPHWFLFKNRLFKFSYMDLDSEGVYFRKRIMTITGFTRNHKLLEELIAVSTTSVATERTEITIHTVCTEGDRSFWKPTAYLPFRTGVQLANSEVVARINESMKRYKDDEEWHAKHGIVRKLTYLFSGPPGTGKTSLTLSIASMDKRDVYSLGNLQLGINDLMALVGDIPPGSLLLMEDIHSSDVLTIDTPGDTVNVNSWKQSSLSGYLNMLAGVIPLDDVIIVMTTNYKERLVPELYRPGRVDQDIYVGYLDQQAIGRWLEERYSLDEGYFAKRNCVFDPELTTGRAFQLFDEYRDDLDGLLEVIVVEMRLPACRPSQLAKVGDFIAGHPNVH